MFKAFIPVSADARTLCIDLLVGALQQSWSQPTRRLERFAVFSLQRGLRVARPFSVVI